MGKNKRVGVLFSGGLDSTYLVWKNLKEGNTVVPLYIEIQNNGDKPKLEKNRIEVLRTMFNEEFDNRVEDIRYSLSVEVISSSDGIHLQQVPIWLMGMLYGQGELDELQAGYVANDDAISYLSDIKKIYNSYRTMVDDLVPLTFPLMKCQKWYIINELPMNYRNLTVTCEGPRIVGDENDEILDYEPCGNCVACKKILNYDNFGGGLSDKYKKLKFENAMEIVESLGDGRVETKNEDGRYFKIIEVEEPPSLQCSPEPHQLSFSFVEEIEETYEKAEAYG